MNRSLLLVPIAIVALSVALGVHALEAQTTETRDMLKPAFPFPTETYAPGAATLQRDADGFTVHVRMPTPVSGTYTYPEGAQSGAIEVFTLWAIVFN